ncbi:MAG: hypothetical protein WCA79_04115 [Anaerolineales bacterium]
MASETSLQRLALALALSLVLLIVTSLIPRPVLAASLPETTALPDFTSFVTSVENGQSNTLRGVYVDGVFALPVVQQPPTDALYVSKVVDTLTQFSLAARYGNIGLLAHNYLSGQYFSQLTLGERVFLVYGRGQVETMQITKVYRYQATDPNSSTSDFIDLDTHQHLTDYQLFSKVYLGTEHVTFQTCIEQDGNLSWGRLFVIAEPDASQASPTH